MFKEWKKLRQLRKYLQENLMEERKEMDRKLDIRGWRRRAKAREE